MLNVLIHVGAMLKEIGVLGRVSVSPEQYDALQREAELATYHVDPMKPVQVNGVLIEVRDE